MSHPVAVWFRNDLRLHDHEPLVQALKSKPERLLCIYVIDPFWFGTTRKYHFPRTGPFRARFMVESLADLKRRLQLLGSDLLILRGNTTDVLVKACRQYQISQLYYHLEAADEEIKIEADLNTELEKAGVQANGYWGSTLYHLDDLPFAIEKLPPVFTQFRIACEQKARIRPPLSEPSALPPPPVEIAFGELLTLQELGLESPVDDPRSVLKFQGGETAALERLNHYFWHTDRLGFYKNTRNGLLGPDYSSKFSPWLAHGCISPRWIASEVARYERDRVQNDSTYWLVFELIWRDYFRFLTLQAGKRLFYASGPSRVRHEWHFNMELFEAWRLGRTGVPFVDANMRELLLTGFQSNRGRQNVASFLVKNLGIDWRAGAEWFESQLIDFDVCSNWGNWAYVAGVGNDPRQDRYFHVIKQAGDYDPNGKYVRTWLPELESLSSELIHEPWKLDSGRQNYFYFGFQYGRDYPRPIIDLEASYDRLRTARGDQYPARSGKSREKKRR